jgi:tetratricopeptide (TPR) repeat protein
VHDPLTRRARALAVPALAAAFLLAVGGCSSNDEPPAAAAPSATVQKAQDTPGDDVATLIAAGLQQVSDQQYDAARATFDQVLDRDATNVYGTYNLGYIAQLQGDDTTAIQRYTTTLATDKDFAPALYNLAILTESSDLKGAVALYRREIQVKPDDAAAYMRLGFALKHLGDRAEGEQMLQQGIALDPSMADVKSPTYAS